MEGVALGNGGAKAKEDEEEEDDEEDDEEWDEYDEMFLRMKI